MRKNVFRLLMAALFLIPSLVMTGGQAAAFESYIYGWAFDAQFGTCSFFNVLSAADECCLTVELSWYWIRKLLRRRPQSAFEGYCDALMATLAEIPEVSNLFWEEPRS